MLFSTYWRINDDDDDDDDECRTNYFNKNIINVTFATIIIIAYLCEAPRDV